MRGLIGGQRGVARVEHLDGVEGGEEGGGLVADEFRGAAHLDAQTVTGGR